MSHVTHINESYHTHEQGMSTKSMSYVTHTNELCLTLTLTSNSEVQIANTNLELVKNRERLTLAPSSCIYITQKKKSIRFRKRTFFFPHWSVSHGNQSCVYDIYECKYISKYNTQTLTYECTYLYISYTQHSHPIHTHISHISYTHDSSHMCV